MNMTRPEGVNKAPIARKYLPYESFVGGFVAAMCVTDEDEEMPNA